jgi:aspartyl-tRNA(Asn)/glutamyl-tRNA(Gln) amidotransferase subunit A
MKKMSKEETICFMSAVEIVEKIKNRELTSQEVIEIIIERIERINPIINAYCTTSFDLARETAKSVDNRVKKGEEVGPIAGIPTSIKDLNLTKGIRTTFGSKLYENFIPEEDGEVVKRLKNAGCVILGKTNTPEFGFKNATDNFIFGTTKNPWNLERTPGGSSGGAAAAEATGLCILAQGSDSGGSIRHPSSFCGLYGLKPSYGRVPHYPKEWLFGEFLKHIGPIVRNVKDAALMLDVMKGPHDGDKNSLPADNISYLDNVDARPKNLEIGYSLDLGYAKVIEPEVEKSVIDSVNKFEEFGWNVKPVKIKMRKPELPFYTYWTGMIAYDFKPKLAKWRDKMDPSFVKYIEAGMGYTGLGVWKAIKQRNNIYDTFYRLFKEIDILITPSLAVPAFELGIPFPTVINGVNVSPTGSQPFSFPFNMTGNPAASIPCGWTKDGLPIGMQIVGRRFDDLTVLQVSKAFETIAPWQEKIPQL